MKIYNKSATFDYTIKETLEAGIKLTGPEVKSVKGSRVSLTGSFVKIIGSETYLINCQIQPYIFARVDSYDPKRTRKLLLSKKEIINLKNRTEGSNILLVPISMYVKHGLVKVEIGLGIGKRKFEKRAAIKKRIQKRELEREFRGKIK